MGYPGQRREPTAAYHDEAMGTYECVSMPDTVEMHPRLSCTVAFCI